MSFMLALPKISLHGAGAIGDMVKLVAGKRWGKALIVTDGQLVKLGLLDSLFAAMDEQQMAYHLFDEVFPNPTEAQDLKQLIQSLAQNHLDLKSH